MYFCYLAKQNVSSYFRFAIIKLHNISSLAFICCNNWLCEAIGLYVTVGIGQQGIPQCTLAT